MIFFLNFHEIGGIKMKRKFICFMMLIVSLVAVRFLTVEQVSGEENGESLESIFTEFYNERQAIKNYL